MNEYRLILELLPKMFMVFGCVENTLTPVSLFSAKYLLGIHFYRGNSMSFRFSFQKIFVRHLVDFKGSLVSPVP